MAYRCRLVDAEGSMNWERKGNIPAVPADNLGLRLVADVHQMTASRGL